MSIGQGGDILNKRVMPASGDKYISRYFLRFFKRYHAFLWTGMHVLDLGSGRFRHARFLRHVGIENVTCVDKLLFPNRPVGIDFFEHDLEHGLPICASSSFDLIVCSYVFMFIEAREQLLDEINRVARAGAFLVLVINCKPLSYGTPVDIDHLVEYLVATGQWCLLDSRSGQGSKGVVLQKRCMEGKQ